MLSSRQLNTALTQHKHHTKISEDTSGIVYDVVLSSNSKILSDRYIPDEDRINYIGCITFRNKYTSTIAEDLLPIAFPKSISIKRVPVKNERVIISTSGTGFFYYEFASITDDVSVTSEDDNISADYIIDSESNSSTYSKVSSNSIPRSNVKYSDTDGYGSYFERIQNIHKLSLYEGDTLLESRFGQSIRLSGYNNATNNFSPTIVIRNGESLFSRSNNPVTVTEDINRDNCIILLSTTGNKLPFKPGILDSNGISDFKTKPNSFINYPTEYNGNQILLNSDRLIFSARSGELIFYAKKNYGFISDGTLSIDNRGGVNIKCGDVVSLDTDNSNVLIKTGRGGIHLGNRSLEPLVKGDQLVKILESLIDAILQQSYLTPVGPSSIAPVNFASFIQIRSQLRAILSTLNKTS